MTVRTPIFSNSKKNLKLLALQFSEISKKLIKKKYCSVSFLYWSRSAKRSEDMEHFHINNIYWNISLWVSIHNTASNEIFCYIKPIYKWTYMCTHINLQMKSSVFVFNKWYMCVEVALNIYSNPPESHTCGISKSPTVKWIHWWQSRS